MVTLDRPVKPAFSSSVTSCSSGILGALTTRAFKACDIEGAVAFFVFAIFTGAGFLGFASAFFVVCVGADGRTGCSAGPSDIFNDELLAERARHVFAYDARNYVGRSASQRCMKNESPVPSSCCDCNRSRAPIPSAACVTR